MEVSRANRSVRVTKKLDLTNHSADKIKLIDEETKEERPEPQENNLHVQDFDSDRQQKVKENSEGNKADGEDDFML